MDASTSLGLSELSPPLQTTGATFKRESPFCPLPSVRQILRTQELRSLSPRIQRPKALSVQPGAAQNVALHAFSVVGNYAFLVSAFSVNSSSQFLIFIKYEVTCIINSKSEFLTVIN